jgi:phosphoglycerate kinase
MLSKVLKENKHPFLFMLGGAKFGTKIPLLKKLLPKSDHVFITGALSNNFFLNDGYPIGKSLIDKDSLPQIKNISTKSNMKKIYLPEDVVVTSNGKNRICLPSEVKDSEMIVDIGDRTIEEMKLKIQNAKMILWNGPTSAYEMGYITGTTELLKEISKSKAMRVIGGGDTAALITKLKLADKLGFVSTGGGAMLDFLAKGTLPGIKALK